MASGWQGLTTHPIFSLSLSLSLSPFARRLISQMAKEIYNCEGGKVTRIQGSIEGYKNQLQKKLEKAAEKFEKDRRARAAAKGGGGAL
jgi:hypothetical protein